MTTNLRRFSGGNAPEGLRKAKELFCAEDGVVVELFVLFIGLVAVLAFGMSLQLPTNQASALRATHALQVGSAAAAMSLDDKAVAAEAAWDAASQIVQNGYVAETGGIPGGRFSSDLNDFLVMIPNRRADQSASGYFIYNCSGSGCSTGSGGVSMTRPLAIAARIFDINYSAEYNIDNGWEGTYDAKNAVMLYATVNPLGHSATASGRPQPVVAVARLVPTPTYILVDTAMSGSDRMYDWIFGPEESNDSLGVPYDRNAQFPVVYDREGSPKFYPGEAWNYPTSVGVMRFGPRGEDAPSSQETRNFFASACFNSPWDLYKGAAVDLIDYLQSISAYDRLTGVGIVAPLRSYRDVDPNFTAASASGADRWNYSPLAHFDMPHWDGGGSDSPTAITTPIVYMGPYSDYHLASAGQFTAHFHGMIKWFDPYDTELANKDWNKNYSSDAPQGVNMWNTLICRGFVTEDDTPTYSLTDDRQSKFTPGTEPSANPGRDVFDYRPVDTRRREAAASNNPIWRRWPSSYRDWWLWSHITLGDGAAANQYHGARNFIAGLAPSWLGIQEVIKDVAGSTEAIGNWTTWNRNKRYGNGPYSSGVPCNNTFGRADFAQSWVSPNGSCNNVFVDEQPDPTSASRPASDTDYTARLATGWRNIPSAMRAACESIASSKTGYMSNAFMATERPLGAGKLVVFGFGLYSPVTSQALGLGESDRKNALAAAINFCSCNKNIEIIFNFLPLTPWDRQTVAEAADVVSAYQRKFNHSCKPLYFPDESIAGCAETKSIQFFVSEPASFTDPGDIVDAAAKFRDSVKQLKPLFSKFVYNM